jgi:serine/threonine protein kinase
MPLRADPRAPRRRRAATPRRARRLVDGRLVVVKEIKTTALTAKQKVRGRRPHGARAPCGRAMRGPHAARCAAILAASYSGAGRRYARAAKAGVLGAGPFGRAAWTLRAQRAARPTPRAGLRACPSPDLAAHPLPFPLLTCDPCAPHATHAPPMRPQAATMDEVEVLAKLDHPNIVHYHDCFSDEVRRAARRAVLRHTVRRVVSRAVWLGWLHPDPSLSAPNAPRCTSTS